jgi:hypothetical protein
MGSERRRNRRQRKGRERRVVSSGQRSSNNSTDHVKKRKRDHDYKPKGGHRLTNHNLESASVDIPINDSNRGAVMFRKMGYAGGPLKTDAIIEPVKLVYKNNKRGIGL